MRERDKKRLAVISKPPAVETSYPRFGRQEYVCVWGLFCGVLCGQGVLVLCNRMNIGCLTRQIVIHKKARSCLPLLQATTTSLSSFLDLPSPPPQSTSPPYRTSSMAEASVEQVAAPPPSSSQQFSFMSNLLVSQKGVHGRAMALGMDGEILHARWSCRFSYKHV